MSRYVFKMPDLGEGTVSAEVVAWHVKPGDLVQEDQVMCEVMTEKAAVEMPAPVTGRILSITGSPGDMVAVGSELVVFDTDATSAAAGTRQRQTTREDAGRGRRHAGIVERRHRLVQGGGSHHGVAREPPPRRR